MSVSELRKVIADLALQNERTAKTVQDVARQLGGLGNKFGSFTEGLMIPSLKKILKDKFHVEVISPNVEILKGGKTMELDLLAYSNGSKNQVYIVEIKSHLDKKAIIQIKKQLSELPKFLPEHKDKDIFGMLAAVDFTDSLARQVIKEGLYLAQIHDDIFRLQVPSGFRPKSFK